MYFWLIAIDDQTVSEQEVLELDQKLHELISSVGGQIMDASKTKGCIITENRQLRRILRLDETSWGSRNRIRLFSIDDYNERSSAADQKVADLLAANTEATLMLRRAVADL